MRNHSQLMRWGQYWSISKSDKGSTKRKFQTNVSHKFGIKSFHSHTYKSNKWIQKCIKISLDSFWSLPKSGHITYLFKGFKWIKDTVSSVQFSSIQSLSRVRLFATPWIAECQASLFITTSRSSLRLTSIESVMPSSHLILCRPLLLLPPSPPSIRVFSNESAHKCGTCQFFSAIVAIFIL